MMHRHLLTALHATLSIYLDPAHEDDTLSILDAVSIGDATTRRTLAKLRDPAPNLRTHAQAGTAQPPLIVTQQLSRRVQFRPLGGTSQGEESTISRQEARVEIIARTSEEVEILANLVSMGLQQSREDFVQNGYLFFSVDGLDELAPHEQLAAEELGLFIRRLSVSAMIQEGATRLVSSADLGPLTIDLALRGGRVEITSDT